MQNINDIQEPQGVKKLKDFIPLVLAFFLGLIVLTIYQNISLFYYGVLDTIINKSLLIQLLHHLGFVSVAALVMAFIFKYLENKNSGLGFKTIKTIIFLLIGLEAALITFYILNYEPLGSNLFGLSNTGNFNFSIIRSLLITVIAVLICQYSYIYIASLYKIISRMYPFTIILFSMFLATLYSEKKPINENKTQHLVERVSQHWFNNPSYEGEEEFPLLKSGLVNSKLGSYFRFTDKKPNIKIIIIEGLGADFAEPTGVYSAFMPKLKTIHGESLFWSNFLSNTGESYATLPSVLGSLPFGENGFTNVENFTNRNTLYSVLGSNDYFTTFNYGGNSALNYMDRFLEEEKVNIVIDKKAFGDGYSLQKEDQAGITLGYPDKELFNRYLNEQTTTTNPKLDVFLTQSTKAPYHIPNMEKYAKKVNSIVSSNQFNSKTERIINNNIELFASFIYVDEAIAEFLKEERKKPNYENTIYIITGSHNSEVLPHMNAINKYEVPLFMHSPLLTKNKEIKNLASHTDIAPTLLSILSQQFNIHAPKEVAWLGSDLLETQTNKKKIPLLRSAFNIQDYISNGLIITDGNTFKLGNDLQLSEIDDVQSERLIKKEFEYFKTVNYYTTTQNKIVPAAISLITNPKPEFSKGDMIWIESVFNGKDFDQAYTTAKMLAINKKWDRSILLCDFILSNIPRHPDTEILKGRVYAWQEKYATSTKILKDVVRKYPNYEDGYCALMDTYYWSGNNDMVHEVQKLAKQNKVTQSLLSEKIKRSLSLLNDSTNKLNKDTPNDATVQNLLQN